MKRSFVLRPRVKELFPGSDVVRKFTFQMMNTRDTCALLARAEHQLAFDFADSGARSALFQNKDCFDCLTPHEITA